MLQTIRFVLILIFFFNIGEYYSDLPEKGINIYISIITLLLFFLTFFFTTKKINFQKHADEKLVQKIFIALFTSNLLLIYFIIKNIGELNIISLAIFMEKYRNGYFQGSGLYTFLSTNIIPLLLSYYIFFFKFKRKVILLFLLLSIIPLLSLGLRVFVIPIVFSLLSVHFQKNKFFSTNTILFFILLFILTISTKLLLIPESSSFGASDMILKVLTRTNYQAITVPNGFKSEFGYLLTGNIDKFKEIFYNSNFKYIDNLYLSEISNSSGLAIPLIPLLINQFGYYFGTIFSIFLTLFILKISSYLKVNNKLGLCKEVLFFYITIFLLASVLEDFSFIYKIIYIPFLCLIIFLFNKTPKLI
jgi:hypothetical protein